MSINSKLSLLLIYTKLPKSKWLYSNFFLFKVTKRLLNPLEVMINWMTVPISIYIRIAYNAMIEYDRIWLFETGLCLSLRKWYSQKRIYSDQWLPRTTYFYLKIGNSRVFTSSKTDGKHHMLRIVTRHHTKKKCVGEWGQSDISCR